MTERLLQYIWQFQYFNPNDLHVCSGESLQIIHPGNWNTHQGPDFLEATIKIGDTRWIGNVELHIQSSDWFRHSHQDDRNYKNVVLHVVWENDDEHVASALPLLVLQDKVPKMLLAQYEDWMKNQHFIPCGQYASAVNSMVWTAWKDRLVTERLTRKTLVIEEHLNECNHHWDEVFWWLIARNFGIKVNADAFEAIARSLSIKLLVRHKKQIHQVEALLFGQAALLETPFEEAYPKMLQKEYRFYQRKYRLEPIHQPIHFLRMRPDNFPSIRLAQLAVLIQDSSHLFSTVIEAISLAEVKTALAVTANDYWHYHYRFGEASPFRPKRLGHQTVNNILINTIIPVVFAFGFLHKKPLLQEKALKWLQTIGPETNGITAKFDELGIVCINAMDTQALLELKAGYCDKRRCLECAVGNAILKKNTAG